MIKRLAANLVIDSGVVVNSYNFTTHLPVGKLQFTLKRLQEFEVDEVIILNASHSNNPVADFCEMIRNLDVWHMATPLAYGGGINCVTHAIEIIKAGAERVVVSSDLFLNRYVFDEICKYLGDQAVILHLPLEFRDKQVSVYKGNSIDLKSIIDILPANWGGEVMFSFIANDGAKFPDWKNISTALGTAPTWKNLILSGGFADSNAISRGMNLDQVSAIGVGNFMHRSELSVIELKNSIDSEIEIRRPR